MHLMFFLVLSMQMACASRISLAPKLQNGLLTPDYGILTAADLKNQALHDGTIPPLGPKSSSSAQAYWACFPLSSVKLGCEVRDPVENTDGLDVEARDSEGVKHIYFFRRGDIECAPYMKKWKKLTKDETHVCLAGFPSAIVIDKKGQASRGWVFDKIKTKRGCDAYFGDCASP